MATGLSGLYGTPKNNSSSGRSSGNYLPIFSCRVKDIVLDQLHTDFIAAGEWNGIGAIRFENSKAPIVNPPGTFNTVQAAPLFAYPLFPNIKQYPLLEEIALNNVDLPTLGNPTIPQVNPIVILKMKAQKYG